jgi:arsenate reductase
VIQIYGIPNCDSVKKARDWFDVHGVSYSFHDYKKQGVPEALLRQWVKARGWEVLLNRKGTTWRELDSATRTGVVNGETAIGVMLKHPSTIKRPVVTRDNAMVIGVDVAELALLTAG